MNLGIESRMGAQLERYMDLATDQTKLTATNMANIDTPGYKTMGMDFEVEMGKAISQIDSKQSASRTSLTKVDGLITRPDGNNVSMDRESLNMAEAQLKFRTGVALMRLENQKILSAIHASDK